MRVRDVRPRGRIVAVCVGVEHPRLVLLDPRTLDLLASLPCRRAAQTSGGNPFTDFSGGATSTSTIATAR